MSMKSSGVGRGKIGSGTRAVPFPNTAAKARAGKASNANKRTQGATVHKTAPGSTPGSMTQC